MSQPERRRSRFDAVKLHAALMLAEGETQVEVARRCGCSRRTVLRWLRQSEFVAEVRRAERAAAAAGKPTPNQQRAADRKRDRARDRAGLTPLAQLRPDRLEPAALEAAVAAKRREPPESFREIDDLEAAYRRAEDSAFRAGAVAWDDVVKRRRGWLRGDATPRLYDTALPSLGVGIGSGAGAGILSPSQCLEAAFRL
jgi:transcriptional regulator with XRE-family HTH domain